MEKEIKKTSETFGVKVWFTSDSHIQHRNILKHCPKRAAIGCFDMDDVEGHDKWLIDIWNKTIAKNDIVYILCCGNNDNRNCSRKDFKSNFFRRNF